MKSIKLIFAFITLITFFLSTSAWALSSDKNKPVEVEADSFNLDDAKKVTIYSGNVIITQGSMEIMADKVTIYGAQGDLQTRVCLLRTRHYHPQGYQQVNHIAGQ